MARRRDRGRRLPVGGAGARRWPGCTGSRCPTAISSIPPGSRAWRRARARASWPACTEQTGEERYADAALRALEVVAQAGPGRWSAGRRWAAGRSSRSTRRSRHRSSSTEGSSRSGAATTSGSASMTRALRRISTAGVDTLAGNIERWDTGYWSLYDLFPHPGLPNVASAAYHSLHIMQLRAMQIIAPRPELRDTVARFEGYEESRMNAARAFAEKALFRVITPRNRFLAHRAPWSESRRGRNVKLLPVGSSLVLCYHAVSHALALDTRGHARPPSRATRVPGAPRLQRSDLLRPRRRGGSGQGGRNHLR